MSNDEFCSMKPIEKYVNILSVLAEGEHPLRKPSDRNEHGSAKYQEIATLLKRLCEEGFVNAVGNNPNPNTEAVITPKGALALHEWNSKIQKKSIQYKVRQWLGRLAWVVIGAGVTYAIKTNS